MKEVFKAIPGYEGYYEVSNLGNVRSIGRRVLWRGQEIYRHGMALTPHSNLRGYRFVTLSKAKERKIAYIHRLVAETFIDNPLLKNEVNHIDGNKNNNSFENLEWVTRSENCKHACALGLMNPPHGKRVNGYEKKEILL